MKAPIALNCSTGENSMNEPPHRCFGSSALVYHRSRRNRCAHGGDGRFLVVFTFLVGTLYFRLQALPGRFANRKRQYEIVCALSVISMFTQMYIFFVAALLLAFVDLPDLTSPLRRVAGSVERLTFWKRSPGARTNTSIARHR